MDRKVHQLGESKPDGQDAEAKVVPRAEAVPVGRQLDEEVACRYNRVQLIVPPRSSSQNVPKSPPTTASKTSSASTSIRTSRVAGIVRAGRSMQSEEQHLRSKRGRASRDEWTDVNLAGEVNQRVALVHDSLAPLPGLSRSLVVTGFLLAPPARAHGLQSRWARSPTSACSHRSTGNTA